MNHFPRILTGLLCAVCLLSCKQEYDETELLALLGEAEAQIDVLQERSDTIARKIATVKALVEIQQNKDLITEVEPVYQDGDFIGYNVSFELHDPIFIANGDIELFTHSTAGDGSYTFGLTDGSSVSIPTAHPGAILFRFSVAQGCYVYFSKGNLQYHCKNRVWRFAEPQWATIGDIYTQVDANYNGWISHFGWGTSGYHNPSDTKNIHYQPYDMVYESNGTSYPSTGYGPQTAFDNGGLYVGNREYDWGVHNAIANGGNRANVWRTMTMYEWQYVIDARPRYSDLRSICTVDGVLGMVLMPDEYYSIAPRGSFTADEFSQYERYGAVFLPAEGYRYGTKMYDLGTNGFYWSSSQILSSTAGCANFRIDQTYHTEVYRASQSWNKPYGLTIRLVQDVPAK